MITVFTTEISSRLRYIFELYFEELLQIAFNVTTDPDYFEKAEGTKLNYSHLNFRFGQLNMRPHPLLFERGLDYQDLSIVSCEEQLCFFKSSEDSFMPFDPFAAGFFLVSRYEEYLERQFGKHRRYPSHHSVLSRNHNLNKPIVNQWAQLIAHKIQEHDPTFHHKKPTFDFLTTIDVDNAWAYKNKSWKRLVGASLKSFLHGNFMSNKERFLVLAGKKQDPYDTYDFICSKYTEQDKHLHFFFLLGKPGRYDRNVSPQKEHLRQLIRHLSKDYEVGIHPSYRSTQNKNELLREIKILEDIIGSPVKSSRQHFLKLELPKTYRRLIKAGIQYDYTMGYSDVLGFRAGIASPFWFYDLRHEEKTKLRIVPFQTMDVTMKDYLNLTPTEAISEIKKIMYEIKKSGGTFISLWHNESLSNKGMWKDWRAVFEEMTELALKLKNESS